jgi:hypothetical protein
MNESLEVRIYVSDEDPLTGWFMLCLAHARSALEAIGIDVKVLDVMGTSIRTLEEDEVLLTPMAVIRKGSRILHRVVGEELHDELRNLVAMPC